MELLNLTILQKDDLNINSTFINNQIKTALEINNFENLEKIQKMEAELEKVAKEKENAINTLDKFLQNATNLVNFQQIPILVITSSRREYLERCLEGILKSVNF